MQISNRSNAFKYSVQNISLKKRLIMVLTLMMSIGALSFSICLAVWTRIKSYNVYDYYPTSYSQLNDIIEGICVIGLLLFMFAVLIELFAVPLEMFSYLHRKTKTDMIFSLPLTKKQRFISDYLTGFSIIMIPLFVVGVVCTLIITIALNFKIDNSVFDYIVSNSDICPVLWKTLFCGFLMVLFAYTTIVMVCQFVGTIMDGIIFSVVTLGIIPAVFALIAYYAGDNVYCGNADEFEILYEATSPVGNIIYLGINILDMQETNYPLYLYIIIDVVFILLTLFAAYKMHLKRTAESVGKSIVFKAIYNIFVILIAVCVTAFAFVSDEIVVFIIAGVVVFSLFVIFSNRGKFKVRKIIGSFANYVFAIIGTVFVLFLIQYTETFGYGNFIPSAGLVKNLSVDLCGGDISSYIDIDYTDKSEIKKVEKFHKKLIKQNKEFDLDSTIISGNIYLQYELKTGIKITRSYDVSLADDINKDLYEYIVSTESFAESQAKGIRSDIMEQVDQTSSNSFHRKSIDYYSDEAYYDSENVCIYVEYGKLGYLCSQTIALSKSDAKNFADEMYDAVYADYSKWTIDDIISPDICLSVYGYTVTCDDKNIISVLEKYGVELLDSEEIVERWFDDNYNYNNFSFVIADPEDYVMTPYYYDYTVNEEYTEDDYSYYDDRLSECFDLEYSDDLFKAAKAEYISSYGNIKTSYGDMNIVVNKDKIGGIKEITAYSDEFAKLYDYAQYYIYLDDSEDRYYLLKSMSSYECLFIPKNEVTESIINNLK